MSQGFGFMVGELVMDLNTVIKFFLGIMTAVVGWFCKSILQTQRDTDLRLHKVELDMSENYHKKADAILMRQEHREELKRVHDRLDIVDKKIDDLPLKLFELIKGAK